ncbi:MAG: hypothetical protein PHT79_02260 [Syntrophomonadaceae bacterium]|nr:hypothetical protein [Syntrophomonadaceae bacterium]MDD4548567.1 hypothetical protein [Syntrophomonadaceae bacterium]
MSLIPDFLNNDYYLPKGEYKCTIKEMEESFLFSDRRKMLWKLFKDFTYRLTTLGITPDAVLVNGSFVTKRTDPGDVDFVFLIPMDKINTALATAEDEHDETALLMIFHPDNQLPIRILYGVHFLYARNQSEFEYWSYYFQNGVREPDPKRDPPWVKSPTGKGILYIDGGELINGIE